MCTEKQISITINRQEINFKEVKEGYSYSIYEHDTAIKNNNQFELLTIEHSFFLPTKVTYDEHACEVLCLVTGERKLLATVNETLSIRERIRLCLATSQFESLIDHRVFVTFLHPDHLFIAADLQPKLAYRGIANYMFPYEYPVEQFLKERKALIINLLFSNISFEQAYFATFLLKDVPDTVADIIVAKTNNALDIILVNYYSEIRTNEIATQREQLKMKWLLIVGYLLLFFVSCWFIIFNLWLL